ncbi:hypothetical protein G3I59_24645 [Amycolatopsis rubida]|uniref:Uncharacterized protein n=1 Tax=Amycolatopsis rubida TaxID=112413 RepID=A0A1I6AHX3_9PSEU|nr:MULTISPECIES: hypothetical protein [Amycolatopsis]MYW93716.1 hypothetical protein [Amycolatopsis rubida]NEC58703.1 hypothetical protein [Amycolatopsis rubida]OAP22894.1 hypothetical protein A4R44_06356 [Amycolatopsis sp. M39]SFQ68306.1 hypothetical protein SAMN05421854_11931 [Amycolatopsis rubida]
MHHLRIALTVSTAALALSGASAAASTSPGNADPAHNFSAHAAATTTPPANEQIGAWWGPIRTYSYCLTESNDAVRFGQHVLATCAWYAVDPSGKHRGDGYYYGTLEGDGPASRRG